MFWDFAQIFVVLLGEHNFFDPGAFCGDYFFFDTANRKNASGNEEFYPWHSASPFDPGVERHYVCRRPLFTPASADSQPLGAAHRSFSPRAMPCSIHERPSVKVY